MTDFDWQHPDYSAVIRARVERLGRLRANPELLPALRAHYAERPADFISDWGSTYDPRNPERGLPASMPFLLFDRQREMVEFLVRCWRAQEPGLIEKSRDMGASWLMMAFAATMCLFHHGLTFGIGSRKEELVDRSGDPSSLFFKARHFLQTLPPEFLGGWDLNRHSAQMRLSFPATGSAITGEGGDQIGRGGADTAFATPTWTVTTGALLDLPDYGGHDRALRSIWWTTAVTTRPLRSISWTTVVTTRPLRSISRTTVVTTGAVLALVDHGRVPLNLYRGGPTNLDKIRGRDKWNSAGYAAAASD